MVKINEIFPEVIGEDLNYEFKSVLSEDNPLKWAKTIVAFSNSEGGIVFVGVSNDREAFGLTFDQIDKTKNLVALVNDRHIFPHARLGFSLTSVDDNAEKYVLAIKVYPSDSIVRYRDGDFSETVYVKGDGNSTKATPEQIVSLSKRKYGVDNSISDVIYDEREWTSYLDLCRTYRDDHSIPDIKELQSEDIVSKDGFSKTGLLMFKDDYQDEDSLIVCRLWKGKDKLATVLDSARYKGSLSDVFKNAITFIERNTKTGWKKTENGGRAEVRSYPKEAIREVLVNAIAHRDYSLYGTQIDVDIYEDRIEVVSPGSWLLPKKYEEYELGTIPSIRRNLIIAACLDVANLMERGGTGFKTIVEAYNESPFDKQPVVSAYPGFLNIKIFDLLYETYEDVDDLINSDIKEPELSKQRVIGLLKKGPKDIRQLHSQSSYSSRSYFIKRVINPLLEEGIIKRVGDAKSPNSYFELADTI